MEGGKLLEKAAANITVVKGVLSPTRAQVRPPPSPSPSPPAPLPLHGIVADLSLLRP